jgi:hypothetical protein
MRDARRKHSMPAMSRLRSWMPSDVRVFDDLTVSGAVCLAECASLLGRRKERLDALCGQELYGLGCGLCRAGIRCIPGRRVVRRRLAADPSIAGGHPQAKSSLCGCGNFPGAAYALAARSPALGHRLTCRMDSPLSGKPEVGKRLARAWRFAIKSPGID